MDRRAALQSDIDRLRREQNRLSEFTPTLPEALQAATASRVAACKKQNGACVEAKLIEAAAIRDRGITIRARELEAFIPAKERELAGLPAVATADPEARGIVKLVTWASMGFLSPAETDVWNYRTLSLALICIFSGLLFMGAISLLRG